MHEDLHILAATVADADEILALQKLAYQSEARLYDDWSIPPLTQSIESLRDEFATRTVLKALARERIVGSVRAGRNEGVCEIGRLIVHPDHQGRGIGTRLLGEVEQMFANVTCYELFTGSRSVGNIRLYERCGYVRSHVEYISPAVSLVFLRKTGTGTMS